ncbi:unnamed protein product [Durusdinium trenchii]|uniref:Uncharacterized protein n=2 Tax=Durusdinium trenchii TaxID=1381693 RepID=A0ABP0H9N7_9DINO
MPKTTQGSETKKEEEVSVECSTSAASGECQDDKEGSQHESEEVELRSRQVSKRWADVESDEEDENFQIPDTQVGAEPAEESGSESPETDEWQEVTKSKKPSKTPSTPGAAPGSTATPTSRSKDVERPRDGRRNDRNRNRHRKEEKDPEKKEGQPRRQTGTREGGNPSSRASRRDGRPRGEKAEKVEGDSTRKENARDRRSSGPKENATTREPREPAWRKKSDDTNETRQVNEPKPEKEWSKPEKDLREVRTPKEPKVKEDQSSRGTAPNARAQRGTADGPRNERGSRGGQRTRRQNGGRPSGQPTAEDWFASRMATA